jgi:hypothetical protein
MSDAIENEMHSAPLELMQIAANYVGSNPTKVPKVYNVPDEVSGHKGNISKFPRGRIINYYCRL